MEYAHNDEEGEESTLVGEGAHCVVGGQRGNSLQEEKICLDRSEILGGQQAVLTKGCPITLDEIMSSSMTLGIRHRWLSQPPMSRSACPRTTRLYVTMWLLA